MPEDQQHRKRVTWIEIIAQRQGITVEELRNRIEQEKRDNLIRKRGCVIRSLESALSSLTGHEIKAATDEWNKRISDTNNVLSLPEDLVSINSMLTEFSENDTPLGKALKGINWEQKTMSAEEIAINATQNNTAILPLLSIKSAQGQEFHLCHIGLGENNTLISLSDNDAPFSIAGGGGIVFVFTTKD